MKTEKIAEEFINRCVDFKKQVEKENLSEREKTLRIIKQFNDTFKVKILKTDFAEDEDVIIKVDEDFLIKSEFDNLIFFLMEMGLCSSCQMALIHYNFMKEYLNENNDLSKFMTDGFDFLAKPFREYQLKNLSDNQKKYIEKFSKMDEMYEMLGDFMSFSEFIEHQVDAAVNRIFGH